MPAFLLRRKAAALIWQYLDGVIPANRFELLQRMLARRGSIRRQFVDSAVINALLFAYFNPGRYTALPTIDAHPKRADGADATNSLDADLAQLNRSGDENDSEERPRRTKRPAG